MPHWEVQGGGDAGGIVVREGQALQSKAVEGRLATGAVVMQVELVGDRLHYYLVMGNGPGEGWVSIKTKSSVLLKERDITVEPWYLSVRELRSKKKEPAELLRICKELLDLCAREPIYRGGLVSAGFLEAGTLAFKSYPEDIELQCHFFQALGDCCLFNAYASRKAGKAGIIEAAIAFFKANMDKPEVQVKLGSLGCFFDYDPENRRVHAELGGIQHCWDVVRKYQEHADADVVFNALCAVSSSMDFYEKSEEAGAAETMTQVLRSFRRDNRVRSEAGMVAKTLLHSPTHARECAARFGQVGMGEEFVVAMREHLLSRPMQSNGASCLALIAAEPQNRGPLLRAGAVDVLLAVFREEARGEGFCWGLEGMEDNLWPVQQTCGGALLALMQEGPEVKTAMVQAGAIEHLQAALRCERRYERGAAYAALAELEAHRGAEPAARWQPRSSFEGRWITNNKPNSPGILSLGPSGDGFRFASACPDCAPLTEAPFSAEGGKLVLAAGAPEAWHGLECTLVEGAIYCNNGWTFYPWHGPDE